MDEDPDPGPLIMDGAKHIATGSQLLRAGKTTDTTRKYFLHYRQDVKRPLKAEFSYRQGQQIDEDDVVTVDGIRTYRLEKLTGLKIDAFASRTKARDIFDVSYHLERHPDHISNHDLLRIGQTIDIRGMDGFEDLMMLDPIT
jgi:domain of unknown function (DUF1814)